VPNRRDVETSCTLDKQTIPGRPSRAKVTRDLIRYIMILFMLQSHTAGSRTREPDLVQVKMVGDSPGIDGNLHKVRVETARYGFCIYGCLSPEYEKGEYGLV
jgi:hypothetical protein